MSALVAAIPVALAQDFPVRPVRLVVANPPGGTADLVTRLLAKQFSERWKQPAVVDNRGGAAGLIGTDIVAKAVPDGYTVLVSAPGPLTTHMFLGEKLPYRSFERSRTDHVACRSAQRVDGEPQSPGQVGCGADRVHAKANPGKLSYASSGTGNPSHLRWQSSRRNLSDTTPWTILEIEDATRLFGRDWYPYGVEKNRSDIEQLSAELHEEGLAPKRLSASEILPEFEASLRDSASRRPIQA